jgi:hypothetical protein
MNELLNKGLTNASTRQQTKETYYVPQREKKY